MKSWIAIDKDRSVYKSYSITSLPTTVVIDRNGIVADVTFPSKVTEQKISEILTNRSTFKKKSSGLEILSPVLPSPKKRPLMEISIKLATDTTGIMYSDKRKKIFQATALKGRNLFAEAYGLSSTLVFGPDSILNRWYDVSWRSPNGDSASFIPLLQSSIELTFSVRVRRELRDVDALILVAPYGATKGLFPTKAIDSHMSTDDGLIVASAGKIEVLASNIETILHRRVFDQTNLLGKYDWDLQFTHSDFESLRSALHEQLGLDLHSVSRKLDVLMIEPAKQD